MNYSLPRAPVLEWDSKQVRTRCPYCSRIHTHGFGKKPLIGQSRAIHCHLDGYYGLLQYRLLYPFEEEARGYYLYEIDKDRKKFVVVDLEQDSEESEEEDDAEDERVDTSNTDSDEYERSVGNDGKNLDAELADLADNLRLEGGNEEQATGLTKQRTEDLLKEMM